MRREREIKSWKSAKQDNGSKNQGTLRTTDKREAERLLNAMNESHREPTLNLNLARAYLAAHDPKMAERTWQAVMDEMQRMEFHQHRFGAPEDFAANAYDPIATNRSSKRLAKICSLLSTLTEIAWRTICDDFTI